MASIESSPADPSLLVGRDKEIWVTRMFDRIAGPYDRLNRLISLGQDLRWRRRALDLARVQSGERTLDIGTGTGDLLLLLDERVGPGGHVSGLDISEEMLKAARAKWKSRHPGRTVDLHRGSAEATGFADASFDVVTMGWVLRNVGDRQATYREVLRILAPGGRFVCIDMSRAAFAPARLPGVLHMRVVMPALVRTLGADMEAYRYLASSTARFPHRAALAREFEQAGFRRVRHEGLMLGNIALHVGEKERSS